MAGSGHRSFGELAREALAHQDWPEDTRAQPRSLEAIFGRLDWKEDLDWLQDRPGVQQVLAEVLRCQVSELRTVLAGSAGSQAVPTRLRFDDLPAARALELQIESPPPTIPDRVTLPGTWQKLAWIGKPGCGFSLVQHWLKARGLAQTLHVEAPEQIRALDPESRQGMPLFVEVDCALDETLWRAIPQHRPLCLGVKSPGRREVAELESLGFETVESSEPREQLEAVVDWVLARAPHGVQSRRPQLLDWLRRYPGRWELLESLGDLIGWIGAYVESAEQGLQPKSKEDFLRRWLGLRASMLVRERLRDRAELTKTLPNVLIDSRAVGHAGRYGLPARSSPTRSVARARSSTASSRTRSRLACRTGQRRSATRPTARSGESGEETPAWSPPHHRGTSRAAATQTDELESIRITSPFLNRLLVRLAEETTVESLPVFWGEALLKPKPRASLIAALERRIKSDPEGLIQELLEIVESDSAPLVGALEASFVVAGLAVLAGAEVSESTSQSLLEEQQALLLDGLGPLPVRRTIPLAIDCVEDTEGAFYLAAFALAECGRQRHSSLSGLLDPWSQTSPPPGWDRILDAIAETLRRAVTMSPGWLPGALKMLDRLRQSIGSEIGKSLGRPSTDPPATEVFATESTHPIFLPGTLLDAIELSVLSATDFWALVSQRWQLELFLATLSARGLAWENVADSIWNALLSATDHPRFAECLALLPEGLWRASPPTQLARVMLLPISERLEIPWKALPATAWQAWSERRQSLPQESEPTAPWREIPSELGESHSRALKLPRDAIRRVIWERWPEVGIDRVEKHRTLHPSTAQAWLDAAPVEVAHALARATSLHGWHRADERVRSALRRRLHEGVAARSPGWLDAYDCLELIEIERRRSAR
ncbi:MAG: hypothetical protein QM784_26525 [Polyangiaceae bacterium]